MARRIAQVCGVAGGGARPRMILGEGRNSRNSDPMSGRLVGSCDPSGGRMRSPALSSTCVTRWLPGSEQGRTRRYHRYDFQHVGAMRQTPPDIIVCQALLASNWLVRFPKGLPVKAQEEMLLYFVDEATLVIDMFPSADGGIRAPCFVSHSFGRPPAGAATAATVRYSKTVAHGFVIPRAPGLHR